MILIINKFKNEILIFMKKVSCFEFHYSKYYYFFQIIYVKIH
jgi:hypothetical protein